MGGLASGEAGQVGGGWWMWTVSLLPLRSRSALSSHGRVGSGQLSRVIGLSADSMWSRSGSSVKGRRPPMQNC